MNWDTKLNGTFVPWGWVQKAMYAMDRGDLSGAKACLMHPVKGGLLGGPDVTAVAGKCPDSLVAPGTMIGFEIKAEYLHGSDRQSEAQIACQKALERHGAIYLVVEDVESGLKGLERYVGPGAKA